MAQKSNGRLLKSTSTTLRLIEFLQSQQGVGVQEAATELAVSPSTAHSHLATLEHNDYVVKRDGQYQLGMKFLGLGVYVRTLRDEFARAEHYTDVLAAESGCRAVFTVEEHGHGYYIYTSPGKHGILTKTTVGKRVHLHSTGTGKAILASLPPARIDSIVDARGLPSETAQTIRSREEIAAELETIREQGYAVSSEEQYDGLTAVGVPVRDPAGDVIGAIGVAGPSNKLTGDRFETDIVDCVLGIANEFELNLSLS